ncbi:peptidyl-tRNA hydrolase [Anaerolinea thermolimosa]|uniref:aminoacyl-tRNA hydrolase n=1 Tax=Anaerolinea thermolimosa TaxID=229919 RepID=UPI0007831714|nr:aminoacyl-tRNA hydrolase [Anaerolinea thermolimosa]GAP06748.1 peptidyl-tRNA hydrolase [Anaerolinea thermolimosa]
MFHFGNRRSEPEDDVARYLIVGLGNPGREYQFNRHNIGFLLIDRLCRELLTTPGMVQSKAIIAKAQFAGKKIILAKPQTYMNLSGQSVSSLVRFYKIPNDHLLVAHDDLDLPLGTIRLRPGGGSGGQKGVSSIIQQLGTQDFPRLRIGIGRPPGRMDAAAYVLQDFNQEEREILPEVLDRAAKAALVFIENGLETAMNQFNGNKKNGNSLA